MKTTTEVSVSIDWVQGVATILGEFDLLADQGIHISSVIRTYNKKTI
jgi:hypothetical protein